MAGRDAGDEIPVRGTRVGLRGRSAVNRDGGGADVFHPLGELGSVDRVRVPSCSHLHGDRNGHGAHHRAHDLSGVRGLAHQTATGVVLRNLRHRTSHVHVDDVGAHAFDDLRGGGHLLRIAAEDLDRDRALLFGVFREIERPIDAAHQPLGADHLGHDETAPALPLHEPAECAVGHAGHGRHGECRSEIDRANFHGES